MEVKIIDLKYLLIDTIKFRNLQEIINHQYNDNKTVIIPKSYKFTLNTNCGMFYLDDDIHTIPQVEREYDFTDLRKTDIVLDIGACIGGFSIKVSPNVKQVYSIEPIRTNMLKDNIKLNHIDNITVFDIALGNGYQKIRWVKKYKCMNALSLQEIINLCGGHIDFLKCDCEGGEWNIKPNELNDIRRIEAEIHIWNYDKTHNFNDFINMLKNLNYTVNYKILNKNIMLLHARKT